jgi:hypothetical protein
MCTAKPRFVRLMADFSGLPHRKIAFDVTVVQTHIRLHFLFLQVGFAE